MIVRILYFIGGAMFSSIVIFLVSFRIYSYQNNPTRIPQSRFSECSGLVLDSKQIELLAEYTASHQILILTRLLLS